MESSSSSSEVQLREELEDTRIKLQKAAECGNSLLSTNQLLNDKLEAREKEYAKHLEVRYLLVRYLLKMFEIYLHCA